MSVLPPYLESVKSWNLLRLGVLAAATGLYALALLALLPVFGPDAALLSLLPVALGAWWYGALGSAVYGALVTGLSLALLSTGGVARASLYLNEGGAGLLVAVYLVGLIAGGLAEYRRRIDTELERRLAADEARRSAESRHQALLAAVPDLMFRIDAHGALQDLRMAAGPWKRLFPQAKTGRNIREVLGERQGERLMQMVRRCLAEGSPVTFETAHRLDGGTVYLETRMTVSGRGEVLAMVRDITQSKVTEIELHWQAGVSAAMAELAQALIASASVKEISSMVLEHARRLTGSTYGFAGYIDPQTGFLVSSTLTESVWELCQVEDKGHVFERFGGLWGWVLENHRPLMTNDAASDPRSSGLPPGHLPIRRFLSVPAMFGSRLTGQIALANPDHDYTDRDFEVVARLADLYAVAIREHFAQEEVRASEERYRTIFETTGTASMIIEADTTVSLVNTQFERFSGYSKAEIEGKLSWTAFVHPDHLERMQGYHHLRRQDPDAAPRSYEFRFLTKEGRVLETLLIIAMIPGTQRSIASIIDITQRKRDARIQSALYQISNAVHSCDSLDGLYRSIHTTLGGLMPAENFFIALYDAGRDLITFPYFVDQNDPPPEPRTPGKGMTEYLLRSEQALMITWDEYLALSERGDVTVRGTPFVHWMGVPLRIGETVMGAMAAQSYTESLIFGPEDLNVLRFVSDQVAMAIERKQVEEKLKYLSVHDPLTGLYNRGYFEAEVRRLEHGRKFPVSVVVADMNGLKPINDRFGHAAGDEMLRRAARAMRGAFRGEDCVARIGGDEFAVLLPGLDPREAAQAVERLRALLDQSPPGPGGYRLSLAIGAATAEAGQDLVQALKAADERMYHQKPAASRAF